MLFPHARQERRFFSGQMIKLGGNEIFKNCINDLGGE